MAAIFFPGGPVNKMAAHTISNVTLKKMSSNMEIVEALHNLQLTLSKLAGKRIALSFRSATCDLSIEVNDLASVYRAGPLCILVNYTEGNLQICLQESNDADTIWLFVEKELVPKKSCSKFDARTEETSAMQYFQFYGYLSQQQNMLQDHIRTATYQSAFFQNYTDFAGKVILDVGAGTGILSFFAVQAGAKKVYAVEASNMAQHCRALVKMNNFESIVTVIEGKIEEVEIPESVDVIISEPMGYMLFNERMLESFLYAKKWLVPGGKMFPTQGDLYISPFMDDALFAEQSSKTHFWYQQSFYGLNLSCLRGEAFDEYLRQPIVDTFDLRILLARPVRHVVNFLTSVDSDLERIEIPFQYDISTAGNIHGLAFWFDVAFVGSAFTVWLSTAPSQPLTHWYQVRCLLKQPVFVKAGDSVMGKVSLKANEKQSYDIDIKLTNTRTGQMSVNSLDLKNPYFRYTGIAPQNPPGSHHDSPSEKILSQPPPESNISQGPASGGAQIEGGNASLPVGTPAMYSSPVMYPHGSQGEGQMPAVVTPGNLLMQQVMATGSTPK